MALCTRAAVQVTPCSLSIVMSSAPLWTYVEFEPRSAVLSSKTAFRNVSRKFEFDFRAVISTSTPSSRRLSCLSEVYENSNLRSGKKFLLAATSIDSPFTEKYSPRKNYGNGLVSKVFQLSQRNRVEGSVQNQSRIFPAESINIGITSEYRESNGAHEDSNLDSLDENEPHLPELREVLTMLRARWDEEAASGERRRGPGNVYLVGTGPGDPELLTLKALRLMQSADLVLYDRLVSTDILDLVHAGARLLYVGKTSGFHSRTQEEIHELLLNFAEAGATVLRLKGGDPLVFGRGGEEMDFLQEQGIEVKVVPGITSASGIAAELGIPLTHRGAANSVRFLTGHSRKGGDDPLYVAEQAADPDSTLVIYMGLATLPGLAAKLTAHGLSPHTPAAAVERGTTPQQRTVFATLSTLPEQVIKAQLVSPTLIFIGRVVALSPLWPTDLVSGGNVSEQEIFLKNSTFFSPALIPETTKLGKEPRDRRQRSPDPALPSQQ